jgi:integrase
MATIEERISSDGSKSFRVRVRLKGRPAISATFNRKTDAKDWARSTEVSIKEGRYFKTAEAKRHTLGELINRYLDEVLPDKPKSIKDQSMQLKWWKTHLGDYLLSDISASILMSTRNNLRKESIQKGNTKTTRSNATVNRYMAALSHVFSVAVREWEWMEDSPIKKITRLKEDRGRTRFLNDKERERLLAICKEFENDSLYLIVVIALSTGARQGEILNLRWNNVDLKRRQVTFVETKNDEIRTVPLQGLAYELIKERAENRRIDTTLIFPSNTKPQKPLSINSVFRRAVQKAKLDDFRFHDLRHSAASYLAMNGASLAEIAEILGHKTLQMVKRYAHLTEQHTASVVSSMNEKIFNA